MEYMACGQAIIVNDMPDSPTPQALRDRVISVPPGDSRLLGEAIGDLLKDKDLRKRIGERALNFIEEGYTWKDAAEKTQGLLLNKKQKSN
ncbi:MAG: glycosyltransferase [Candidatus Omnitrophica bacterium]|nr:glycosyltransferase [Candidatus Omnitrophota bacterium]